MARRDRRFRETPRVFSKSSPPRVDLTGQRFGKLTIVEWVGKCDVNTNPNSRPRRENFWLCQCDCGDPVYNPVVAMATQLRDGNTTSCGCNRRKHKMSGTRIYTIWTGMIGRCTNPSNEDYHRYGGRGITVCAFWRNSFENFYADMGDPPTSAHTLDRIDNDTGYGPDNCRWATRGQQNRNRRNNRSVTWDGETKLLAEWGEDIRLKALGITDRTLCRRLHSGWNVERAMTTPISVGKMLTFQGETLTMMGWSRRLGASEGNNVVSRRLRSGWSLKDALQTPI